MNTGCVLTAGQVRDAAAVLDGVAVRTPLLESPALDSLFGGRTVFKAENLQHTGAFKFRGAYHHVATLDPSERAAGVVGASSGNHAQALAMAGGLLGCRATVVIPADAPETKVQNVRRLGGEIVTYRRGVDDRDAIVAQLAHERGLAVVPSANSVAVMAGAGTVAAEILADARDVDTLLVPCGGGGLAAGCATLAKAVNPGIRVIGVEPLSGDDTRRSISAGRRVQVAPPATIADGLTHTTPAQLPFRVNRRLLDGVVAVDDAAIAEAMRLCFQYLNIVTEPSGATALAALVTKQVLPGAGRTAVVLSGGNVDWSTFRHVLETAAPGGAAVPVHAVGEGLAYSQ